MTKRPWIPLLLLLSLSLAALAWFGLKMVSDEQKVLRAQFSELLQSKLQVTQSSLSQLLAEYEQQLEQNLSNRYPGKNKLRQLVRESSIIDAAFLLNANGSLAHPRATWNDLSNQERELLKRLSQILEGNPLKHFKKRETDSSAQVLLKKGKYLASFSEAKGEWYPFFWNKGLHLLFFVRLANQQILGVELNRSRFLAETIAALPAKSSTPLEPPGKLELVSASGEILYQWGNLQQAPILSSSLQLAEPLNSWRLHYHVDSLSAADKLGRSLYFNVGAGLVLLALALSLLGYYTYRQQTQVLREAEQKVNFVNQVSHELKTPLTNIRMYAELLENKLDDSNEAAKGHLKVITTESQRLSRLIANVLQVRSSHTEKQKLKYSEVMLNEVVSEVIEQFTPSFSQGGLSVALENSLTHPYQIDSDVLRQILGNLLSNIEKYAPNSGQVKIALTEE